MQRTIASGDFVFGAAGSGCDDAAAAADSSSVGAPPPPAAAALAAELPDGGAEAGAETPGGNPPPGSMMAHVYFDSGGGCGPISGQGVARAKPRGALLNREQKRQRPTLRAEWPSAMGDPLPLPLPSKATC